MKLDVVRSRKRTLLSRRPRLKLSQAAEEMFRHIPAILFSKLKADMEHLPGGPQGMIQAFKTGNYSDPIFQQENWVLYAMRELANGTITADEYGRLMLYDDCHMVEGFETLEGYHGMEPYREELFQSFQGDMSREDFDRFLNSLDCNDQIFKISPPPADQEKSLSEALVTEISAGQFASKGTYFVFPPNVMEKFLSTCTQHPMKLNPVNGYSTPEKFESHEKRDVYIPNRYVSYPKTLHNLPVRKAWEIYWHDANYHLYVESANPHREYWSQMGVHFKEDDHNLYNVTIDRELVFYSPRYQKRICTQPLSKEERFWLNIPLYLSLVEAEVGDFSEAKERIANYFSTSLPEGVSKEHLDTVCDIFSKASDEFSYPNQEFLFGIQANLSSGRDY